MQTYASSKLIQKYYQAKAGRKFAGIVAQVDTAGQMAARLLGADFVAIFYCGRGGLIPISYQHGHHLSIRNLGALESFWTEIETDLVSHEPAMIELTDDSADTDLPYDQFGADNSFACNYQYPYYVDGDLRLVCSAYWYEPQPPVALETEHLLGLACRTASVAMNTADDLAQVENYSAGLSRLMPVFELPLETLSYQELVDHLLERVKDVFPESGILILQREKASEVFVLDNYINCERPSQESLDALLQQVEPLLRPDLPEDTVKYRCRNLGQDDGSCWSRAVMLEISPDPDVQIVLVTTAPGSGQLSATDRELLAVMAVFIQAVLRNALLVRQLKKTNMFLDEASQRLAGSETVAALADMTSGLAHDFNNVFGALIGRIQLMQRKAQEASQKEGLDNLERLALEGAESVRRIQEFVTSVKQRDLFPVDLGLLLEELVAPGRGEWQESAVKKGINVSARCRLDDAVVAGDREGLLTVLDKLVDNAVRFAPDGSSVAVEVVADGDHISIAISDQGPGIPEELRAKIFYPFYTSTQERGAGLGLAIVQSVVSRLHGRITVGAGPSGGAVFTVTLQRTEEASPKLSPPKPESKKPTRLRILVVDDDGDVRDVLMDVLSIDGHMSVACPDGLSALEEIDKQAYDIMITDLGMPGMSGLELAGKVHERFPKIAIGMVTGWGAQLDESECALRGVKSILSKPFHLKDVRSLVDELSAQS